MRDPYLLEGSTVLRNLLNITDEEELETAESVISSAMMLEMYEKGFHEFSTEGLCQLHKAFFGSVYDWAGSFRSINISKREPLLAGLSVWYSNCDTIKEELQSIWKEMAQIQWDTISHEEFVDAATVWFPKMWRVHPFREGNTRTIIALLTFFFEEYGYSIDRLYLAENASIVRDALVFCCFDKASEPEHFHALLERASASPQKVSGAMNKNKATRGYYRPQPHEYIDTYESAGYEEKIIEALKNAKVYFPTREEE